MRFVDLLSLILYNLGRRKGRVLLTAIGVVIGTAAVVVLVSLAVGLQKNATESLWGISDLTSIEVYPGYDESMAMMEMAIPIGGGGGGMDSGMRYLTPDAIAEISAIPGVKQTIIHDYMQASMELYFGKLMSWGNIIGINVPDLADMGLEAERGTTELAKGTAVIGSWVPQNFYNPNPRPGEEMTEPPDLLDQNLRAVLIKWTEDGEEVRKTVNIRIVGILKETRGMADGNIYMNLDEVTTYSEWARGTRINRNKEGYSYLIVKAEDPEVVLDVADQINALGYMANTPQSYLEGINSFFLVLQIIFGGIGAIALLVAAIGIANTMTMSILERTREIGLMKAVGATNRDVLSIFLGEAAGIGFVGGLGGVVLGWAASAVLNVIALSYFASQASAGGGGGLPAVAAATPPMAANLRARFCHCRWITFGFIPRAAGCHPGTCGCAQV